MSTQLRLPVDGGLGRRGGLVGLLYTISRPALRRRDRKNHSMRELAEMCCMSVAKLRPLVDDLIELGYVEERAGVLYRTSKREPEAWWWPTPKRRE